MLLTPPVPALPPLGQLAPEDWRFPGQCSCSTLYRSIECRINFRLLFNADSVASLVLSDNCGTTMAAKTARISTTISSSTSVKPMCELLLEISPYPLAQYTFSLEANKVINYFKDCDSLKARFGSTVVKQNHYLNDRYRRVCKCTNFTLMFWIVDLLSSINNKIV